MVSKLNTPKIILSISIGILLLCNCYRVQFYDPPAVHEPNLQKEGELHTALTTNDLQLAYSPINNYAVMLSGYFWQGTDVGLLYAATSNYTSLKWIDAGFGRYDFLGNSWYSSIYGGGGFGKTSRKIAGSNSYDSLLLQFIFNTNRFFIQPGFYRSGTSTNLDINLRFTLINYSDMQVLNPDTIYYPNNILNNINNKSLFVFEPTLTFETKFKILNLFIQVAPSFKLDNLPIDTDGSIFTIGISKNFYLKD